VFWYAQMWVQCPEGSSRSRVRNTWHIDARSLLYMTTLFTNEWISRIWGSHGGEYEDGCLLGCSDV
jgi:hypothetical protein